MEFFNNTYYHLLVLIMQCTCIFKSCVTTVITDVVEKLADKEMERGRAINQRSGILDKYINLAERHEVKTNMLHARDKRSAVEIAGSCSGLCERSLCPWNITIHCVSNRVPKCIEKAVCITKTCRIPYSSFKEEKLTTCETIKRDILVYKNSKYTHERNWPVGCACTKQTVSRVQRTVSNGPPRKATENKRNKKRHLISTHRRMRLINRKKRRERATVLKRGILNQPWFWIKYNQI